MVENYQFFQGFGQWLVYFLKADFNYSTQPILKRLEQFQTNYNLEFRNIFIIFFFGFFLNMLHQDGLEGKSYFIIVATMHLSIFVFFFHFFVLLKFRSNFKKFETMQIL